MPVAGEKFKSGDIVCTAGVDARMSEDQIFRMFVHKSLVRHLNGDWGDLLCQEDWRANEMALVDGSRLFSAYKTEGIPRIWIITEADRSVTTILFPDEY